MKTWYLAVAVLGMLFAGFALADLPGPRPRPRPVPPQPLPPAPKVPAYPLVIEVSPNVAEAKLVIPRKMLGSMKGELQLEETNPMKVAGTPRMHTIIAGAALALGLAFGGLWLVRRGQVSGRAFGLIGGAVLFLGIGAAVWADLGPPRPRPGPRPFIVPRNNSAIVEVNPLLRSPRMNNVVVEVVDQGDSVKLVISQDKITQAVFYAVTQQQAPKPVPAPRK